MNATTPSAKFSAANRAQIKRHLLMVGITDPLALSYVIRQVDHMCKMSFYDGVIAQIDQDVKLAKTIKGKRGTK